MPESNPSVEGAVLVLARDLFFRAKLEAVVRAAGRAPVSRGEAGVAVVELVDDATVTRVQALVRSGTAVLAFGSHMRA
jgi:hypothetical protein